MPKQFFTEFWNETRRLLHNETARQDFIFQNVNSKFMVHEHYAQSLLFYCVLFVTIMFLVFLGLFFWYYALKKWINACYPACFYYLKRTMKTLIVMITVLGILVWVFYGLGHLILHTIKGKYVDPSIEKLNHVLDSAKAIPHMQAMRDLVAVYYKDGKNDRSAKYLETNRILESFTQNVTDAVGNLTKDSESYRHFTQEFWRIESTTMIVGLTVFGLILLIHLMSVVSVFMECPIFLKISSFPLVFAMIFWWLLVATSFPAVLAGTDACAEPLTSVIRTVNFFEVHVPRNVIPYYLGCKNVTNPMKERITTIKNGTRVVMNWIFGTDWYHQKHSKKIPPEIMLYFNTTRYEILNHTEPLSTNCTWTHNAFNGTTKLLCVCMLFCLFQIFLLSLLICILLAIFMAINIRAGRYIHYVNGCPPRKKKKPCKPKHLDEEGGMVYEGAEAYHDTYDYEDIEDHKDTAHYGAKDHYGDTGHYGGTDHYGGAAHYGGTGHYGGHEVEDTRPESKGMGEGKTGKGQATEKGGKAKAEAKGGKAKAEAKGGTAKAEAKGGTAKAAAKGGKGKAAAKGETAKAAAKEGKGKAAAKGGEATAAVPGGKGKAAAPGKKGKAAVLAGKGKAAEPAEKGKAAAKGGKAKAAEKGGKGKATGKAGKGKATGKNGKGDDAGPGPQLASHYEGPGGNVIVAGRRGKGMDAGPAVMHPAAMHPAAMHPAAIHPAAIHPAAIHPAAMHPAAIDEHTSQGVSHGYANYFRSAFP